MTGGNYVAGVVGDNSGTITGCCSDVNVSGTKYVGGIAAQNYGSISKSYNTGEVFSTDGYVGGVVGSNNALFGSGAEVANCYNTGKVSGDSSSYRVGGIVGYFNGGSAINCYNTGEISGYYNIGGIGGYAEYATITNCYWASDVTGAPSNGVEYVVSGDDETESMLIANMKLDDFVEKLNSNAYTYNQDNPSVAACAWVEDTLTANSGCPLLNFNGTPTATE